jgi:ribonucleotide reductase alpha subunit
MNAEKVLLERNKRNIKILFKSFLVLLEDLHKEHEINFSKLEDNIPEKYKSIVSQANYFDEEKLKYIRKKVLDMGNEMIRDNDNNLEHFIITFKFKNQ